jgi:hypothetical protein
MLKPVTALGGCMLACAESLTADAMRLVRAICAAADEGREGGFGVVKGLLFFGGLIFVLEGERCG